MLSIFMSHKICKNIPSFEIHRQKRKDRKEKQRRGELEGARRKKKKRGGMEGEGGKKKKSKY